MYNLTNDELEMIKACASGTAWRDVCDKIKAARDGQYPPDWWEKVKLSGLMDKVMERWGANSDLRLEVQRPNGKWEEIN